MKTKQIPSRRRMNQEVAKMLSFISLEILLKEERN
jgi:hypothetical protein